MPTVMVTDWQLRSMFNDSGLWEAYLAGDLELDVQRDRPPNPRNKQPEGTRSVTAFLVRVESGGRRKKLAFVHYYELPDGTINNKAGMPDPKWCEVDGTRFVLKP